MISGLSSVAVTNFIELTIDFKIILSSVASILVYQGVSAVYISIIEEKIN